VAFGQDRDASILPEGVSHEEGHATSHEKIFVSGDFNYGSQDVITAVNDGKEAAEAIDTSLMGRQRRVKHIAIEMTQVNGETGRVRDHDLQFPPHMPTLPLGDRDGVAEVETGHELEALQVHATRCYWCQHKMEIDHDKCIHCNWCIEVTPRDCINKVSRLFYDEDGYVESALETDLNHEGTYIWIDSHECIRCGKCVRICPTSAITMRKTELCGCSTEEFEEKQKDNQPYGAVEHFKY
jgi:ferredoxin